MAKLVIPTRNRPTSLAALLSYLVQFYPDTEVVIADGSAANFSSAYQTLVQRHSGSLKIQYHRYDPSLPLADRMTDVLNRLTDEIVVVGADDDYPLMSTLQRAAEFLKGHRDYVLATGGVVFLKLEEDGQLRATLFHARSIEQSKAINRLNYFSRWPYATSYSAVRRMHFIERCQRADLNAVAGFGDYTVAFHDCLAGKIKALDELCYIRTGIPTLSKLGGHSKLYYLDRAADILATKDHYRKSLMSELAMTEQQAEATAIRLVNVRIGTLVTTSPQYLPDFGGSSLFDDVAVRGQYAEFEALFRDGSDTRKLLVPQLRAAFDGMKAVASSGTDNVGEPKVYTSLEDMRLAATPASAGVQR